MLIDSLELIKKIHCGHSLCLGCLGRLFHNSPPVLCTFCRDVIDLRDIAVAHGLRDKYRDCEPGFLRMRMRKLRQERAPAFLGGGLARIDGAEGAVERARLVREI